MTPPKVGDVVLYGYDKDDGVEPSAAIVTRVDQSNVFVVNLRIFGGDGTCFPRSQCWYFDGPAAQLPSGCWRWP